MYLRPQAGQDSLLTIDGEGDRSQMKRRSSPHESHSINAKLKSATQAGQREPRIEFVVDAKTYPW